MAENWTREGLESAIHASIRPLQGETMASHLTPKIVATLWDMMIPTRPALWVPRKDESEMAFGECCGGKKCRVLVVDDPPDSLPMMTVKLDMEDVIDEMETAARASATLMKALKRLTEVLLPDKDH
jgi:hypothetical protein